MESKQNFRDNQSYKHRIAIDILISWINTEYLRITKEEKFCTNGTLWFVPDVVCYNENGVCRIYEIVKDNPVSMLKQWRMYLYFELHNMNIEVFQINADWILNNVNKPNKLKTLKIL